MGAQASGKACRGGGLWGPRRRRLRGGADGPGAPRLWGKALGAGAGPRRRRLWGEAGPPAAGARARRQGCGAGMGGGPGAKAVGLGGAPPSLAAANCTAFFAPAARRGTRRLLPADTIV